MIKKVQLQECLQILQEQTIKLFIVFLSLFNFALFANGPTNEDVTACFKKNRSAYIDFEGAPAIAISKEFAIVLGGGKAPKNYVKYDPFLNLYLVKPTKELYFVPQNEERVLKQGSYLFGVNRDGTAKIGKLKELGKTLGDFDKLTFSASKGSIITGVCCDMYGVGVGGDKFIGNRFLEHLLAYKELYYGDIGINFIEKDGRFIVTEVDPFFKIGLYSGDEIVKVGKKEIKSLRELNEEILFWPKGKSMDLQIKRGEKIVNLTVKTRNRPTIPNYRKTYLEPLGMRFDEKLNLIGVTPNSKVSSLGLKNGDKLMQIGKVEVKTPNEVRKIVSTLKPNTTHHLLFERSGFQFFITFEIPSK